MVPPKSRSSEVLPSLTVRPPMLRVFGVQAWIVLALLIASLTYLPDTPAAAAGTTIAVTMVIPSQAAPGTVVTIRGTGFTNAAAVYFGSLATSSFTVESDTQILASVPQITGTVDIIVSGPNGRSPTSPADQFESTIPSPTTTFATTTTSIPRVTSTSSPGSTTSTPSTSTSTPTDQQDCQAALDQELSRNLSYQPSQQMRVGVATTVEVDLGSSSSPLPTIPGPSTTIIHISTTCDVEAQLTSAVNLFAISPPGYQEQSFINTSTLNWQWQVTPLTPGRDLQLDLDLQWIYRPGNDEPVIPGGVKRFHAMISVAAKPVEPGQILDSTLFQAIASSAVTAAGSAVIVALYRRHRKKSRTESKHSTQPQSISDEASQ